MFNADYFSRFNQPEQYQAGDVLFDEGDTGDTIYVIQQGEVQVIHDGEPLAVLGVGELVGEMALIDNMPRSATVVALTDLIVVPVNRQHFNAMLYKTPIFSVQVMQTISHRLRRTSGLEIVPLPELIDFS